MNTSKQHETFISYSRQDKEFALDFAREMKASGLSVWLDQLDIPTGARWDDEVESALRECTIFLIILTPASVSSENVKDEIGYAIDHGKRIMPVLLQECVVPLRLRRFQYTNFTSIEFREGVKRAKQLLETLLNERSTPAREGSFDDAPEQPHVPESTPKAVLPDKNVPFRSQWTKTNAEILGFVDPRLVYALSVPGAIIYLAYLWLTAASFGLALVGYVTLGICFGSLLSLIKLEKPYRVAFISSALIPIIAYLLIVFLGFLAINGLIQVDVPISGGAIPLTAYSYQERLGLFQGAAVFVFLVFIVLTLPFGIIGLCGMFVGKSVAQAVNNFSKGDANDASNNEEVRIEKVRTIAVIFTSLLSAVVSIVIALIT
jgi:hypothetical protein